MATAEEFDQLACAFDEAASDVAVLLVELHRSCDASTLEGGRLTASVHAAFAADEAECARIAAGLRARADDCRARAAVARSYQEAMSEYHAQHERYVVARARWDELDVADGTTLVRPPRRPTPPPDPPAWVTR